MINVKLKDDEPHVEPFQFDFCNFLLCNRERMVDPRGQDGAFFSQHPFAKRNVGPKKIMQIEK